MPARTILGCVIDARRAARFWAKVQKCGPDDCWPWLGALHRLGYGSFRVGKGSSDIAYAHRVAAALSHDDFNEAAHYLHACDNPPCCNPAHVAAGTHQQNIDEMVARERHRTPRPGNGVTKITPDARARIATLFLACGNKSLVARTFGVTPPRVRQILAEMAS